MFVRIVFQQQSAFGRFEKFHAGVEAMFLPRLIQPVDDAMLQVSLACDATQVFRRRTRVSASVLQELESQHPNGKLLNVLDAVQIRFSGNFVYRVVGKFLGWEVFTAAAAVSRKAFPQLRVFCRCQGRVGVEPRKKPLKVFRIQTTPLLCPCLVIHFTWLGLFCDLLPFSLEHERGPIIRTTPPLLLLHLELRFPQRRRGWHVFPKHGIVKSSHQLRGSHVIYTP
jgi:hypothetical protein